MYISKKISLPEFLFLTRRDGYWALLWAAVPTALYYFCDYTFLALGWTFVALLGTALSLLISFKNNTSYGRLWEARQVYGDITSTSRAFGVMVRDFLRPANPAAVTALFARHFAWLTALRYQLREPRSWEYADKMVNREHARRYRVPEKQMPLIEALAPYLSAAELAYLLPKQNRATQLLAEQSRHLYTLRETLTELQKSQLQNTVIQLYAHQGRAENLKSFPYPRHFATITAILLYIFVGLLPFGLLREFDGLGRGTPLAGYSVWANVPFAALLIWLFMALHHVGDSSINPFEGTANDVPISAISRAIEIDLRDLLDETELPPTLEPMHNILL